MTRGITVAPGRRASGHPRYLGGLGAGRRPRWIWEGGALHFPGATEVLDLDHGWEHVGQTAQVLYGEGTPTAKSWSDTARDALLSNGWPVMKQHLQTTRDQVAQTPSTRGQVPKKTQRRSLDQLAGYLGRSPEHLGYARRLAEGRAIGSGQVEGACKHAIGRRLKQTGARWRVRRVNRLANVCCLLYSDQWDAYWKKP